MRTTFFVDNLDGVLIFTHRKCGKVVNFQKIDLPEGRKRVYFLECSSENCSMYAGGVIFGERGYLRFISQLRKMKVGEKISINNKLVFKGPLGEVPVFSQEIEVFEKR